MYKQISMMLSEMRTVLNKNYFKIRLESHPDYPSLIAIKDCLEELGINAYACTGTKDELIKENRPFLHT
jgi:hypothetical protein